MNMKKRPTQEPHGSLSGDDATERSILNVGFNVTVIATTEKGTTAALDEARRLARDLDARVTLLKMKIVRRRFPLDKPPVSLRVTTRQQCSLAVGSNEKEQDLTVRTCLCRDRDLSLQRVLRRRALVVIGGRRHWWLSREERLEKVLRGMGHHVIFIDLRSRTEGARRSRFLMNAGRSTDLSPKHAGKAETLLGSERLR